MLLYLGRQAGAAQGGAGGKGTLRHTEGEGGWWENRGKSNRGPHPQMFFYNKALSPSFSTLNSTQAEGETGPAGGGAEQICEDCCTALHGPSEGRKGKASG
ncbi:hypothetical protein CgunFtcFv8_013772 [Champsocephalus gunnari]|uniref:Uncharacterized protein n=1 Tax=Champsocephalus gunnari TaxID=52237 RepID=A0AAN8HZB2_CHAGU|nr:hypothetical protein CgunFtcFv8_013772 [Champsocephalus gunnari]